MYLDGENIAFRFEKPQLVCDVKIHGVARLMALFSLGVVVGYSIEVRPRYLPIVEVGDESVVVIDPEDQLLDFWKVPALETAPNEQAEVAGLPGVVRCFFV